MMLLTIIISILIGIIFGVNAPIISYTYSTYLAVGIVAALDSVIGALSGYIKNKFDLITFLSGFFGNAILAMLLTYLGKKLNIDISLAVIIVLTSRMFNNLGNLRRYYVRKLSKDKHKISTKN